jgi:hypothetical protein
MQKSIDSHRHIAYLESEFETNLNLMKKISALHLAFLVAWIPSILFAQNCEIYFSLDQGSVLKTSHFDQKDNLTGTSTITIKEKDKIPGGVAIQMSQEYTDDRENIFTSNLLIECINDVLYFDMQDFLDPNTMVAYEEMEIDVSADKLPLPANAKPGDKLENGVITVVIRQEGIKLLTLVVEVFNRVVEAKEKIETPAGTFDCLKIKYDVLSQIGFVKINMSAVEWFDPEAGTVRSESYNKKGKLTGYSVLQEIN